eukprot:1149562-Pelagomonas_calceolata.AAC.2
MAKFTVPNPYFEEPLLHSSPLSSVRYQGMDIVLLTLLHACLKAMLPFGNAPQCNQTTEPCFNPSMFMTWLHLTSQARARVGMQLHSPIAQKPGSSMKSAGSTLKVVREQWFTQTISQCQAGCCKKGGCHCIFSLPFRSINVL